MSGSWVSKVSESDRGRRRSESPVVWALIAEALLAAGVLAVAVFGIAPGLARAGARDSSQQVKRVTIGSHGIVIERENRSDTLDVKDRHVHSRVHSHRHGWIEVDDEGDAIVRVFDDAFVPAGERVAGDVVAVFGSVDVEGHVEGDVVAVLGSVRLKPGSAVDGEVVAIGGVLEQAEGVQVGGETVSVGFMPVSWGIPAISLTLSAILAGWLAAIFLGWLLAMLFPDRTVRVATMASRRTAASLLLGMLSLPLCIAGVFLLFVTVVGIPLAILLPPAYALLCFAGQMAATYVLGCKITGRPLGSGGLMVPIAAGTLLVAALFAGGALLFMMPGLARPLALFSVLLGALIVVGLTAIGTGAFLLSKLGAEPRGAGLHPGAAPPPGPAPGFAPPPAAATGA